MIFTIGGNVSFEPWICFYIDAEPYDRNLFLI